MATNVNDTNDDSDTARANKAWVNPPTKFLPKIKRTAILDQDTILSPTILTNQNRSLTLIGIHLGIRKYWRKYGSRFALVWKEVEEITRKNLLSHCVRRYPLPAYRANDGKSMEEQEEELAVLLPELFNNTGIEELWKSEYALLQMIETIVDTELNVLYFNDAQMARKLIREEKLQPDLSKQNLFSLLTGGEHVGQVMEINADRVAELGDGVVEKMSHMVKQGWAVEGETWAFVIVRRLVMLQILGMIMDQVRDCAFGQDERQCSSPSCNNTSRKGADGENVPLLVCSRCGVSCYCSRECQVSHWKQHKHECHRQK